MDRHSQWSGSRQWSISPGVISKSCMAGFAIGVLILNVRSWSRNKSLADHRDNLQKHRDLCQILGLSQRTFTGSFAVRKTFLGSCDPDSHSETSVRVRAISEIARRVRPTWILALAGRRRFRHSFPAWSCIRTSVSRARSGGDFGQKTTCFAIPKLACNGLITGYDSEVCKITCLSTVMVNLQVNLVQ